MSRALLLGAAAPSFADYTVSGRFVYIDREFDINGFTMEGKPAVIADGVQGFSVSDNGLLLYRKGSTGPVARQLLWFDRTGKQLGRLGF